MNTHSMNTTRLKIQVALLARTREKLDALEERLASLEAGTKTAAK